MVKSLKYIVTAAALLLGAFGADALDLPVKKIDGKDYYYYNVKKGDTLYSISELIGISTDDIKRTNPNAAAGLSNGTLLLFAVDDFDNGIVRHTVKKNETVFGIANTYKITPEALIAANPQADRGVRTGMVLVIPRDGAPVKQVVRQADSRPVSAPQPEAKITVANDVPTPTETSLTHKVETGETFYSVAERYGLTPDQLVDLNPFVDPHHMPVGTELRLSDEAPLIIPTSQNRMREIRTSDITANSQTAPLTIVTNPDSIDSESVGKESVGNNPNAEVAILVLQPFMVGDETLARPTQLVNDFYRGLLLAADGLSQEPGRPVTIIALDTNGDAQEASDLIADSFNSLTQEGISISAIIAPEETAQLDAVCKKAAELGIYVFNPNNIKDETFQANPYVIQANIDQQTMYEKAIDALTERYAGYIPVILDLEGDKNEKAPFVAALTQKYSEKGITPLTVSFSGSLSAEDLAGLNETDRYVFIPLTGSLSTFKRFAPALIKLRSEEEGESRFALFGYPDWTTFRSDALENLHKLDATIYSRFFLDEASPEAKDVSDDFTRWYGTEMLEMVPSQAILGFDTGSFLIRALRNHDGTLDSLENYRGFRGTQSTFRFDRVPGGGFINNALYIINFKPAGQCSVDVL